MWHRRRKYNPQKSGHFVSQQRMHSAWTNINPFIPGKYNSLILWDIKVPCLIDLMLILKDSLIVS
jgi:hypothetical protein